MSDQVETVQESTPTRASSLIRPHGEQRRGRVPVIAGIADILVVAIVGVASLAGSHHASVPAAPDGGPTNPAVAAGPTGPPPPPDPRTVDLRDATIDIPAAAGYAAQCPTGSRKFVDGKAVASHPGPDPFRYLLEASGRPGMIYTDLDGQPGDEVLATVLCRDFATTIYVQRLLALKPMPDHTLRTLGEVNLDSSDKLLDYASGEVEVDGRTVLVPVTGIDAEYRTAEQTRAYRYDNGRFHQIGGPTRLTPIPKSVDQADLNSFAVQFVDGLGDCDSGCATESVNFLHGTGRATVRVSKQDSNAICPVAAPTSVNCGGFRLVTYAIGQPSFLTGADGTTVALMTVSRRIADGPPTQAVVAVRTGGGMVLDAVPVVCTGRDGITAIVGQQSVGGLAQVTLRTADGQETRSYREPADEGIHWTRVS